MSLDTLPLLSLPAWSPRTFTKEEMQTRPSIRAAAREALQGLVSAAIKHQPPTSSPSRQSASFERASRRSRSLEMARSAKGFLVDFLKNPAQGDCQDELAGEQPGASEPSREAMPSSQEVPIEVLQTLKAKLDEFDAETQRDVAQLRARTGNVHRRLQACTRNSESLRAEVAKMGVERKELQDYKHALMDSLMEAVRTSGMASRSPPTGNKSVNEPKPHQDGLVMQCSQKLKNVENQVFDISLKWQAKMQEMQPIAEQLSELQEMKVRSIAQLNDFLAARTSTRKGVLEAGLSSVLPSAISSVSSALSGYLH